MQWRPLITFCCFCPQEAAANKSFISIFLGAETLRSVLFNAMRSSPPMMSPPIAPGFLQTSFTSRGSKRSSSSIVATPPLGPADIDVLELSRLRAENQRNTRLLEEERRASQDFARTAAELERELDRIKSALQKRNSIDILIPKFIVVGSQEGDLTWGSGLDVTNSSFGSSSAFSQSATFGRRRSVSSDSRKSDSKSGRGLSTSRDGSPRNASEQRDKSSSRSGQKPYVAYLMLVERGFPHPPGRVQVLHRFNDFKALHKSLKKRFAKEPCVLTMIPQLPEKKSGTLFSSTLTSYEELQERRRMLEVFFKQLLCIPEVRATTEVELFIAGNVETQVEVSEEALVMDDPFF